MCLDFYYIGLMLLLIYNNGWCPQAYKVCYKRYQCYDGEKELNEENYLLYSQGLISLCMLKIIFE